MTNTEQKWLREIRDNTKQLERIAKRLDAIHRQLDRFDRKDEPQSKSQYNFGEYADRLWKIAYERGKREALEQTEPSCDTCKLKDTTEWCKRQEVCRAYKPKDELQICSVSGRPYTDCCNCEYFKCTADEPQIYGYMTAEQIADYRKMLDNAEHKVYGNVFENEPQTLEDAILYYENLSVQNHSEYYEQLAKWLLELRMHKAIKNIDEQSGKE